MNKKKDYRFFKLSYFLRKIYSLSFLKYFVSEKILRKKIFKYIFDSGYWLDYNVSKNQSRSGKGSNPDRAFFLKDSLKLFIKKNKIKKIIDIGCGDFNWMDTLLKEIDYDSYLGVDIVDSLIVENNKKFGTRKIKFISKDIVNENLDFINNSDLILIRHVFIHLKNSNINAVLNKIKKQNFKFLGITSDPKILTNKDLKTEGRYRDINLFIKPFNLKNYHQIIHESKKGIKDNVNLNVYDTKIK